MTDEQATQMIEILNAIRSELVKARMDRAGMNPDLIDGENVTDQDREQTMRQRADDAVDARRRLTNQGKNPPGK